jgi:hypothetical protein
MYNSIYHINDSNCLGAVYLDLTAKMRLVATPIITSNGIKIGTAEFIDIPDTAKGKGKVSYHCSSCSTAIEAFEHNSLGALCSYCGQIKTVDLLFRANDSSGNSVVGFYCAECAEKKGINLGTPLSKIVSKIITQR